MKWFNGYTGRETIGTEELQITSVQSITKLSMVGRIPRVYKEHEEIIKKMN